MLNLHKNLRSSVFIATILLASTIWSTAFAGSDGVSVLGVGNFGLGQCNAAPLSTTIKSRLCTDPTTGLIFSSENAGAFKQIGSVTPVSPLTANGSLFASSPTTISSTAAMTNGQLLIGSTGLAPVLGTLTGTANQVIVTNSAGGITFTLPQPIATASSPTFAGLTLTGLTATRVPFVGTGGALSDDGGFVWDNVTKHLGAFGISINGQLALKSDATSISIGDLLSSDGLRALILRAGDSDRVTIATNGNVGFGTVPSFKVDILANAVPAAGNATAMRLSQGSDGGTAIILANNVGNLVRLTAAVTSSGAGTDDGIFKFETATNGVLVERVWIDSLGNVTPPTDNTGSLGTAAKRWNLIRGVTITPGDIVMSNGVRLTETLDSIEMVFMNGRAIRFSDDGSISRGEGRVVTQQQIDEYKEWVRKGHKP